MKKSIGKKLSNSIENFLRTEAASGVILILCAAIAMFIANSSLSESYFSFLEIKIAGLSLLQWINDGLMTIFFFVVGMEIKKEILVGELSSSRKAALPIAAALGGMVVPAAVYLFFNPTGPGSRGWGIPMATDIAFAVGILSFFGNKVPLSLKIFLLALAIVDDLGAILVIAFFYTAQINTQGLTIAVATLGLMVLFRTMGLRSYFVYIILGATVWLGILLSGIHATIAGVIIGLLTPYKYPSKKGNTQSYSPLTDLVHRLHPYVSFGIIPIFALANAGVTLGNIEFSTIFSNPIHQGILFGLILGKPLGIFLFSLVACLLGIGTLPSGVKWSYILGIGLLGGVGFTMSIFISGLALTPEYEVYSKTGIVFGSIIAALLGSLSLGFSAKLKAR